MNFHFSLKLLHLELAWRENSSILGLFFSARSSGFLGSISPEGTGRAAKSCIAGFIQTEPTTPALFVCFSLGASGPGSFSIDRCWGRAFLLDCFSSGLGKPCLDVAEK